MWEEWVPLSKRAFLEAVQQLVRDEDEAAVELASKVDGRGAPFSVKILILDPLGQ